jgi:hypothetical protein
MRINKSDSYILQMRLQILQITASHMHVHPYQHLSGQMSSSKPVNTGIMILYNLESF